MVRLELIANRAVEDDLYDLFKARNLNPYYTKMSEVQGHGNSGRRQGDHVFPEENFILIMYCDEYVADSIAEAVKELKQVFPAEGVVLFSSSAERIC